ncbi:NDP-sugar synthase [Nitrospina watsonii]|uniref:Mannose-1-phosphate guanyltransferase n=1 Tax=Nitrospina watsonii TaxID=1323948 RepID=A0ABM9HCG7_9BACT|nr:NDP-sugar synthase [Nitrospina watsonii]CAI2717749.1 Putative Mannose-1-phosphate guanyltransferase [Nitrospina watsonii]
MKAMILAAGFGTRLRPLTLTVPKPMVPVMNRPLLEHSLDLLREQRITDLTINLHHLPEKVIAHFREGGGFGVHINWSQEDAILGTAGGIKQAERFLDDAPFLVMNSDVVADIDFERVLAFHQEKGSVLTLVLKEGDSPEACDPIEIDDTGRIVHMPGVPSTSALGLPHRFTFTGIQIMDPMIFDRIPGGVFSGTTSDVFPQMIADGLPVYGYIHEDYWIDIGQPASYRRIHRDLLDGTARWRHPERSADPGRATLIPPVHIGKDCTIADSAQLGPYTVLGDGCVVGEDVRVDNTVCWKRVTLQQGAAVSHSILGDGVTVPAGERCEDQTRASKA